ncbi:uncharacterized protein LOC126904640 [Daktulosphaira vitifoliae]|uniref:uncharacterized protein LOC126904640 n=1 Tax=Daktulosphaira vitifoliae TaxID=58002 RepID=UPI0021A98475|nr:uncharacterized protein LOC126904640 [Daktulosphaira vitifoliae]
MQFVKGSLCLIILIVVVGYTPAIYGGGIVTVLKDNILGSPEFHKKQSWSFDPDVSKRRAPEFIALHGFQSERLIERIGLGIDGRQDERRKQQVVRDYVYNQQRAQYPLNSVYYQPQYTAPRQI